VVADDSAFVSTDTRISADPDVCPPGTGGRAVGRWDWEADFL